jgi:hypothetical protein
MVGPPGRADTVGMIDQECHAAPASPAVPDAMSVLMGLDGVPVDRCVCGELLRVGHARSLGSKARY